LLVWSPSNPEAYTSLKIALYRRVSSNDEMRSARHGDLWLCLFRSGGDADGTERREAGLWRLGLERETWVGLTVQSGVRSY
jgi:hypothetical protein